MPDFVQVGTFSRSLTDVAGQHVDGNRLVWWLKRSTGQELWRSDDRGVTWTFHAHPTWAAGATVGSLSEKHIANYWLFNSSANELAQTPDTNPGAGGFTTNPFAFTGPHRLSIGAGTFMFLINPGSGQGVYRRDGTSEPPASTLMGNIPDGSHLYARKIPTTNDILVVNTPPSPDKAVRRVTPSPFAIVNTFKPGAQDVEATELGSPVAALSSTTYWVGTIGLIGSAYASYRTTNGGTSWSEILPADGFFVANASLFPRKAYMTSMTTIGGTEYAVAMYHDPGDVTRHRKFFRLAKFSGTQWITDGGETTDSGVVSMTASGVNASGDIDFYVGTFDAAGPTVRIYRLGVTQLSAGVITSKALTWDFRELPVQGSRWTLHRPFPVGNAVATGGRGDPESIHYVRNDTPRLVEFPSGTTDEGAVISWKWKSRAYAFGAMLWEKGVRQVAAVCLGTTGTVVVDLFEDLAAIAARTYSLVFTGGPHERKSTRRIHADVQGRVIQVQLTGTAATFEASGLEVEPTRKRRPTNP